MNEAWGTLSLAAARNHGVFSSRLASGCGIDWRSLNLAERRGIIARRHPGVFVFTSVPASWHQRLAAAVAAREGAYVSHRAAARLHGFDGFSRSQPIEVSFARGTYLRLDDVVVHRWRRPSPQDLTMVDGLPVTSIAATLAQLGVVVAPDRLLGALVGALREGMSPRWLDETYARLSRPGRTGLRQLREALLDPAVQGRPAESVLEMLVERFAEQAGISDLERQITVRTPTGVRRIDLGSRRAKWGIEATSFRHHFGLEAERRDAVRHLELAAEGWHLEYVTWWSAHDPTTFADLLLRSYHARCDQLGIPRPDWVSDTAPHAA